MHDGMLDIWNIQSGTLQVVLVLKSLDQEGKKVCVLVWDLCTHVRMHASSPFSSGRGSITVHPTASGAQCALSLSFSPPALYLPSAALYPSPSFYPLSLFPCLSHMALEECAHTPVQRLILLLHNGYVRLTNQIATAATSQLTLSHGDATQNGG